MAENEFSGEDGHHLVEEVLNGRMTRRDLLARAAVLGLSATAIGSLLAACGGSSSGSASPAASSSLATAPKKGGHILAGTSGGSAKDTLDGQNPLTNPTIAMAFQAYEPLLGYAPNGQLINLLADSIESNSTGTVFTVRLKQGLTFHNGKSVTADDVIFSIQRIINPKNPLPGADLLKNVTSKSMKKMDNLTVQFTLDAPNAVFRDCLAYFRNCIVPVGYDPATVAGAIGTGPWKIETFSAGQQTVFTPNTSYWGTGPYADKLTITSFADPVARQDALLGGTVDILDNVAGGQVQVIKGSAGCALLTAKTGFWMPFIMRCDQKPFSDVRVRQAFKLIVDRQAVIDQALSGFGWVGNDMYSPYDPGYPKDVPQRQQDIEQARSLLKQAGYSDNLTVSLTTSDDVGTGAVAATQVFAQQAKAAGVNGVVNKVGPGVMFGSQYLKWLWSQDSWATKPYLLQAALGATPNAPYNEQHYRNDKWYALVNDALRTVDDTKRNELIAAANKIEYDTGGNIIWSFGTLADGYSTKLAGLQPDTWGYSAMRYRFNLVYFA